jgi:hypothetical protein
MPGHSLRMSGFLSFYSKSEMKSTKYLTLLIVTLMACNKPKHQNIKLALVLKDSVLLPINDEDKIKMSSAYITSYQGNDCLLFWNWKGREMLLFQIQGNKGSSISLNNLNEMINRFKIKNGFCYHNNEQMFGMSSQMDSIYCFDINGRVMKQWPIDQKQLKSLNIDRLTCGLFYNIGYYDVRHKLLYLNNCFNPMIGSVAEFYKFNHFAAIDLSKDTAQIAFTFGRFPSGYSRKLYQGSSCSHKNLAFYSGKIILDFFASDSLYEYNSEAFSKKGYKAYYAASNDFEKANAYFDIAKDGDRDYINEYSVSNDRYLFLHSRSNASYLYRIINKKHNRYNEDGTLNFSIESPWQAVVLNKDLKIIGELYLPEKKLNSTQLIPYKNGFWIASLDDYRKFYYYEIKIP